MERFGDIDSHRPIYDSQVCEVLRLQHYQRQSFEEKLQQDEKALARISAAYEEMFSSEQIQKMLVKNGCVHTGLLYVR